MLNSLNSRVVAVISASGVPKDPSSVLGEDELARRTVNGRIPLSRPALDGRKRQARVLNICRSGTTKWRSSADRHPQPATPRDVCVPCRQLLACSLQPELRERPGGVVFQHSVEDRTTPEFAPDDVTQRLDQATAALELDTTPKRKHEPMKADTILVAIDFSEYQETVLGLATSLASACGARLVIVYAADPALTYGESTVFSGESDPQREVMEKMLLDVRPTLPNVRYTHHYLTGVPAEAIVECAGEVKADFIVIGTHGRTGISRVLMGSVAEAVVRTAPCPVITVKTGKQQTQADD